MLYLINISIFYALLDYIAFSVISKQILHRFASTNVITSTLFFKKNLFTTKSEGKGIEVVENYNIKI